MLLIYMYSARGGGGKKQASMGRGGGRRQDGAGQGDYPHLSLLLVPFNLEAASRLNRDMMSTPELRMTLKSLHWPLRLRVSDRGDLAPRADKCGGLDAVSQHTPVQLVTRI